MRLLQFVRSSPRPLMVAAAKRSMSADVTTAAAPPPRNSPLHALHQRHGGRLVPFAGYALPVQYGRHGIAASHRQCRRSAALFDVSHMQQTRMRGAHAVECIESVCTADVAAALRPRDAVDDGRAALSVLTTVSGGIVDDLIVTRLAEGGGDEGELFVVSNAGRRAEDMAVLEEAVRRFRAAGKEVAVEFVDSEERALLALQGPRAVRVLQELTPGTDLSTLWFMRSRLLNVAGVAGCRVTRCGYTGEDGFEISVRSDRAAHLAEALLAVRRTGAEVAADRGADEELAAAGDAGDAYDGGAVRWAGLGARDSLRLEAGMCLYGSDIDEGTNPVEAGLAWLVAKRRRTEANFPGAAAILAALQPGGCTRRRVGLRMLSGPPARHDVPIVAADGDETRTVIGHVTSGCPSPTLGGSVAMGYIGGAVAPKAGDRVRLDVRGRLHEAQVVRMPFVPARYYQQPK